MNLTVEAIYEDGVLKPIQPLALVEGTHVSLVITTPTESQSGQSPAKILAAIAHYSPPTPTSSSSSQQT